MAIDLKKLRHVVETARFESVTRASEALLITQSALTRSIAEVEAELGIQIFIRLPRGVRVTDMGANFVKRAQRIIGDVENLITDVTDYRELNTGRFRLGVTLPTYQRFISGALGLLARNNPNLVIEIATGSTNVMARGLTAGNFDAVVGHAGLLCQWPDLEISIIANFYHAMMLRANHPVSLKRKITELDILELPLLLPSFVQPLQNGIAALHAKNNLPPPSPKYICDDFENVMTIISATNAYTPVISFNPTFGVLQKKFFLLENVINLPEQQFALATSNTQSRSPAAIAFKKYLEEQHSKHSAKI